MAIEDKNSSAVARFDPDCGVGNGTDRHELDPYVEIPRELTRHLDVETYHLLEGIEEGRRVGAGNVEVPQDAALRCSRFTRSRGLR